MKKYSLNHSVVQQHEQISTYVKPTIEEKPDSVILHRGTNDLRSDDESNRIIRDWLWCNHFSFTTHRDKLNVKVKAVIDNLKKCCLSKNILLIEHHNFNARYHLKI